MTSDLIVKKMLLLELPLLLFVKIQLICSSFMYLKGLNKACTRQMNLY